METLTRLRRATKELLGQKQWPKVEHVKPTCYEEQIYSALVRKDDICFDVGANIGDVALYLSKLVGENGLVVAFEPVWPTYQNLCQRIQQDLALKSPIVTVPAGLSNENRTACIQVPNNRFGLASLASPDAWEELQTDMEVVSYDVNLLTMDDFISASAMPTPTFIKVDVEGAELFTFMGSKSLLNAKRKPLILSEVFAPWEKAFDYGPWKLFSYLQGFGYEFLFACAEGLIGHTPTKEAPFPPEYQDGYNVIAYDPTQHKDRIEACSPLMASARPQLLEFPPPPRPNVVSE